MPQCSPWIELAVPSEEIAREIFEWRAASPDSCLHQSEDFASFFHTFRSEYFQIEEPALFFLRHSRQRLAYVRFRPCCELGLFTKTSFASFVHTREISLAVHPTQRRKGFGSLALAMATKIASQYGINKLVARIHPDNEISKKLFLKEGYIFRGQTTLLVDGLQGQQSVVLDIYEKEVLIFPQRDAVFLVAEIGSNWMVGGRDENRRMAAQLVKAAASAGVNAVKFQTFRSEKVYAPFAGSSGYLAAHGIHQDVHSLLRGLEMAYEDIAYLADLARQHHVEFMSTPFSEEDFRAVDPFVQRHKIASYEIAHLPILTYAATSKKPVFLSTGASFMEEIAWSVSVLQDAGCQDLTLMQCTAAYPASPFSMNLRSLITLRHAFGLPVGLSDHSQDCVTAPVIAVAFGASVIEKHITMQKSLPGPDHRFAIEPHELVMFVEKVRLAEKMMGSGNKEVLPEERELFSFAKRAVQATRPIQKGDLLEDNISILRPGNNVKGAHPSLFNKLIGKRARRSLKEGEGVSTEDVS